MRLFSLIALVLLAVPVFGQFKITDTPTTPLCDQPECEEEAKLQDSLEQVKLLAVQNVPKQSKSTLKATTKNKKSDAPQRMEDYMDETDLLAYAAMEESKAARNNSFQFGNSAAYFLESINLVFFIPKSTVKRVESITTPFLRCNLNACDDIWINESKGLLNLYLDNLTIPLRTYGSEMIHQETYGEFISLGH